MYYFFISKIVINLELELFMADMMIVTVVNKQEMTRFIQIEKKRAKKEEEI